MKICSSTSKYKLPKNLNKSRNREEKERLIPAAMYSSRYKTQIKRLRSIYRIPKTSIHGKT